jgi:hypothetical protein
LFGGRLGYELKIVFVSVVACSAEVRRGVDDVVLVRCASVEVEGRLCDAEGMLQATYALAHLRHTD